MKTYRYLDAQNTLVAIFDVDGVSRESCAVAAVPQGASIEPYVAPTPTVAECLVKIDADTDRIYGAALGNRAEEYTRAATEAQAYKDAGYMGTVPASVQSWATAKGWTATQATDDILTTAAQWTGAQAAIRATRLLRKEQVRTAPNAAGITATMSAWAGFVVYIRGQLGIAWPT